MHREIKFPLTHTHTHEPNYTQSQFPLKGVVLFWVVVFFCQIFGFIYLFLVIYNATIMDV